MVTRYVYPRDHDELMARRQRELERSRNRDYCAERQKHYDTAIKKRRVLLPVNGRVHRALLKMAHGDKFMHRSSCFTAREYEQILIFGYAKHTYKKREDYKITPLGLAVLVRLNDAAEHNEIEHKVMVPCSVNRAWRNHFRRHVW